MTGSPRHWRLLAALLLPLAVVLTGMLGARPAAASTLTVRQLSPQPLSCATAVIVVAVIVDAQPENRVKAISADVGTRVSNAASDSPAGIRETGDAATAIVVGDLLVNLFDPSGHCFTTGDSGECITPCEITGACNPPPPPPDQASSPPSPPPSPPDPSGSGCDGPHADALGCNAPPTESPIDELRDYLQLLQDALQGEHRQQRADFIASREAAGQPAGPFDNTIDRGCIYSRTGDVVCPDANGKFTLTPAEYQPHVNIDWSGLALNAALFVADALDQEIPGLDVATDSATVARVTATAEEDLTLYRFGAGPQSAERLATDADNSAAAGFPYGVSTSSRLPSGIASSGEYGSALRSAIERAGLGVEKTGQSPFHYTVTFPRSLDSDLVNIFNDLFYGS